MLRLILVSILCFIMCSIISCNNQAVKEKGQPTEANKTEMKSTHPQQPTISGIVRQSPPRGMPPRQESKPGPIVPGALVSLRQCTDKEAPAGEIVVSAVTDSTGKYDLKIESGTYFLTVTDARIPYPIFTKGYMGMSFTEADSIQFSKIVSLKDTDTILDIVMPQAWPE